MAVCYVARISFCSKREVLCKPMPWWEVDPVVAFLLTLACLLLGYWALAPATATTTIAVTAAVRGVPARMSLPAGKVHFKASHEWQEVLPHHVLPTNLEIRFDLSTGRNFARLPSAAGPGAASGDGSDETSVCKLLCDAATWGKQERVEHVLQSCHWTPEVLSAPLAEAAGRGHLEVCEALLKARADPVGRGPKGVTALHRAAGEGHEEVAELLLRRCQELGLAEPLAVQDDLGRTCLECAREQDLHGVARRLEVKAKAGAVARPSETSGDSYPEAPQLQLRSISVD
ncbi:unnamed protein product [Durusdinium trenchii]|uniref:Uncharacterized protein n=2 Tax=Durusdinium trenchii TaxID=1381693 RepID=A0ABP0ILQ7_9DINO